MDGSLLMNDVLPELEETVRLETAWPSVRIVVRAWAAKHVFLPCTTTPTERGLQIAYYNRQVGCQKMFVALPPDQAKNILAQYEAGKSGW